MQRQTISEKNAMTNIVLVGNQPITKKIADDFYLDRLAKEGFAIEYWNLLDLLYPNANINLQKIGTANYSTTTISDYAFLKKKISDYRKNTLFVLNITYYAATYKVFRLLTLYNCTTAFFARGTIPFPSSNYSPIRKFFYRFKALANFKYASQVVMNQLMVVARKSHLIKPYSLIFNAGEAGINTIGYGYKYGLENSHIIPVNSSDYDRYLDIKMEKKREFTKPYCVFLDTYLPFHPDFKMLGLPTVDPETYYKSLNHFFSYIETVLKIEVVIAAHPKSDYNNNKNFYNNRPIIKFKTAELVKDAEFVLTHLSTSLSYAILFKKPIIFLYTNDIKECYKNSQYPQIMHLAKSLNTLSINVNEEPFNLTIKGIDEATYTKYKYQYLTNKESENLKTEDIVINTLKDYSKK